MYNRARFIPAFLSSLVLPLLMAGCNTSHAQTAVHPMTDPKSITLYSSDPRQNYEDLGTVQTDVQAEYGANFSLDDTVTALKEKAAALGANGLILSTKTTDQHTLILGGYVNGDFVRVPVRTSPLNSAFGEAVFVHP